MRPVSDLHRVLDPVPVRTLDDYIAEGGGRGLQAARGHEPGTIIRIIEASGMRGRGGAGFPTGKKWRTVSSHRSGSIPTSVVVNGAEGEPGTFKDRTLLLRNPYAVIEGLFIAGLTIHAKTAFSEVQTIAHLPADVTNCGKMRP